MTIRALFKALFAKPISLDTRLEALPRKDLPIDKALRIRWNKWQVPYIFAETDEDLAVGIGLVQAHLRGTQLYVMQRLTQGRLSEVGGPMLNEVDKTLRLIDFGHAAEECVKAWPPETRRLVEAYLRGVNHYFERSYPEHTPPELAMMGIKFEPWTLFDVVRASRVAGTDINWVVFLGALRERLRPDYERRWLRLRQAGNMEPEAMAAEAEGAAKAFDELILETARAGSNSAAIAPHRSESGAAMIANDPHLSLILPNLWVLAGLKSPSFDVVGMMIPGSPCMGLGRNHHIAWGGTNSRAASTDLFDVSMLPRDQIKTETVTIKNRFWRDKTVTLRRSPKGPIISDSRFYHARPGEELALSWVGHRASDEVTALLKVMRSNSVKAFRTAFKTYGVSAQNMVAVDSDGNIGKMLAAWMPRRSEKWLQEDVVHKADDPSHEWQGLDTVEDLPWVYNPPEGYVASANDRPDYIDRPIGFFYSPKDRVNRIGEIIRKKSHMGIDDFAAMHRDVLSPDAYALAQDLLADINRHRFENSEINGLIERLSGWDGSYLASSSGAVAFEIIIYHLVSNLDAWQDETKKPARLAGQWGALKKFLIDDLRALSSDKHKQTLETVLMEAARDAAKFASWGDMHRVRIAHAFSNIPWIGKRFVIDEPPCDGSRETLMKRAHGLVNDRHRATYGAQARQISDMADPDRNFFVIFGGQDGWVGSENAADQTVLWRDGGYMRLPLRQETIEQEFDRVTDLSPKSD